MRERKDFWDRNVGLYDRFMRKDGAAKSTVLKASFPLTYAECVKPEV